MKRSHLCSLVLLAGLASSAESQDVLKNLRPGFSECSPAVFVPLQPEMTVKISAIAHADVQIAGKTHLDQGMLKSFGEEISYAKGVPVRLTVTVNLDKWTGMCSSLDYSFEVPGATHSSPAYGAFDKGKLPRTVAFAPDADAGVILGGGPLQQDLVTEFGYDEKGRRYIRRQVFGTDGQSYQVSYSDHVYKGPPTGRMASFTAHITTLPK